MPVAAPSDRRFRRAHVKPGPRRRLLRTRPVRALRATLVALSVAYAGYRVSTLVVHAPLLQIGRITVRGNQRLSNGEILALLDGLRGQNIVTANLPEWRERLLKSPWVGNAALRRVLPSTVDVLVSERQPMGIGRLGRDLYLVDAEGTVIDEYGPNYSEFDLPVIDGLEGPPQDGGPLIDGGRAALAANLLAAVSARRDLARRISEIDVSDKRDAVVVLEGETALIRLGDAQFLERLQAYVDLAPALHERIPEIEYVDLRFDDRVYVRPVNRPSPRDPATPVGTTGSGNRSRGRPQGRG